MTTLLNDETGEEAKPWSDESEKVKILRILDDHKEVKKGRQKELNSLKEMGVMTDVKRSQAADKRVIQPRWVDREKDGCVKSRLVLKDFNRDQGRAQPEMFAPTPSTLSLKTTLAASSHDRNNHPERGYIAIAIYVHTVFLHANIDQELFAEPLCMHVGDGFLFGPSIQFKLLSTQVMMRIVRRIERLNGQMCFLCRVVVRAARRYSVEANPKCIRDVMAVVGLEDSRPLATPSVKRPSTTESLVELDKEKRPCTGQPWESCCVCVPGAC